MIHKLLRLPPPQEFVWQYLQRTPLAGAMLGLDDKVRLALEKGELPMLRSAHWLAARPAFVRVNRWQSPST